MTRSIYRLAAVFSSIFGISGCTSTPVAPVSAPATTAQTAPQAPIIVVIPGAVQPGTTLQPGTGTTAQLVTVACAFTPIGGQNLIPVWTGTNFDQKNQINADQFPVITFRGHNGSEYQATRIAGTTTYTTALPRGIQGNWYVWTNIGQAWVDLNGVQVAGASVQLDTTTAQAIAQKKLNVIVP